MSDTISEDLGSRVSLSDPNVAFVLIGGEGAFCEFLDYDYDGMYSSLTIDCCLFITAL